ILGSLMGPTPTDDTKRFERRITLGFQMMTGWDRDQIAKDFIETLPTAIPGIPWGTGEFEDGVNSAMKAALGQEHFEFWNKWRFSLVDLTSDALVLNFVLLTAIDWYRKDRPPAGGLLKAFQRNARTLLDRSVYEYCSGLWRGSSDSRIAANIAALRSSPSEAVEPVPAVDWARLVDEAIENGSMGGFRFLSRLDGRVKL